MLAKQTSHVYWLVSAASLAIAVVMVLSGCGQTSSASPAETIIPTKIFEHDGCTGYRFRDPGWGTRWYVKCVGFSTNTSWDERSGKVTYHVEVPTSGTAGGSYDWSKP